MPSHRTTYLWQIDLCLCGPIIRRLRLLLTLDCNVIVNALSCFRTRLHIDDFFLLLRIDPVVCLAFERVTDGGVLLLGLLADCCDCVSVVLLNLLVRAFP